jgi:hypothetical protein
MRIRGVIKFNLASELDLALTLALSLRERKFLLPEGEG